MNESEYKAASAGYLAVIERELERIHSANDTIFPKLKEAMFYSVSAGGKRLRPCLALASCELLGGDIKCVLPIACAIEMIHTYSLIHDDLPCMDDDDMRRGRPSNHKVFGEALAVLAGDGLLSLAYETMLSGLMSVDDAHRDGYARAMHTVSVCSGSGGMVSGQAADLEAEECAAPTPRMLEYIHTHKTADMLRASVLAGAYAAGADDDTIRRLETYSEELGMLFQITDDILDCRGDQALVGKTLGKDSDEGKLTYVALYGLEGAEEAAKASAYRAKQAVCGLPSGDYFSAVIDSILNRSF